jgi:hypothetical protein
LEASGENNFFSVSSEFDDAKDEIVGLLNHYGWSNIAVIHEFSYSDGTIVGSERVKSPK